MPEVITFTPEERQRILMDCASEAVLKYGAQFEAKLDKLSLLLARKQSDIKEKFGDDVLKKLDALKVAIADLAAYKNGLDNKTIDKQDVSSPRFLLYRQSLSTCYKYLFLLDQINIFLAKGTAVEEWTVPSHYWAYVSSQEVKMPEEEDIHVGEDIEEG